MKRLIGVGVGPGDPELITVKAVRVLGDADVVLVPVLAARDQEPAGGFEAGRPAPRGVRGARGERGDGQSPRAEALSPRQKSQPGRAEAIIRAHVSADRIKRLEFALNDTGGVTPRRAAAWRAAAAAVAEEFDAGAVTVAFGTLGDPNLYSTFSYLAQAVRDLVPEVTVETVAGITAMQDLASRAGLSLAEGTEPVTLVPLNGGVGALEAALARGGTVVGYKVGAAASPAPGILRDRLQAAGRLDGAIIGARLGLDAERIAPATEFLPPAAASVPPVPASVPPTTNPIPTETPHPTPTETDIPDIPYLSTLIVPALRSTAIGAALHPRAEPHPNSDDVTAWSPEQQRCDIAVVSAGARNQPRGQKGRVVFVGAGPGAPDLLTQRGALAIAKADVVIWASSLVDHGILMHASERAEIVDSAELPMEGVLPYYQRAGQQNLTIARVHSGDPSLWGAIQEQLEQCEALGLDTEVVPGVSSFTAVAATIRRELTIPEVAQSVILTRLGGGKTPMPRGEQVRELARHGTTMALFLSAARSGQLQDELLQGGYPPHTPCVVAYQVTWPDELIIHTALQDLAATMKERKLWKHTLVLVGPALAASGSRSHLYHPGHFHGYRRADREARKQLRKATMQDGP